MEPASFPDIEYFKSFRNVLMILGHEMDLEREEEKG